MNEQSRLFYQIALCLQEGIGPVTARKLVAYCGGVEAVFKEKRKVLAKIPGVGPGFASRIHLEGARARAEEEVDFVEKNGIRTLFFLDQDYPKRLTYCIDAPLMLYGRGNFNLNAPKVVSVVGTRRATAYGRDMCEELIANLPSGTLVSSGLAYGIDILAHKAALRHGKETVAVLAHGLDRIYPDIHSRYVGKMEKRGGVITDFISRTNPDRENFPKRNRIIAGMADVTVVVESDRRGGSMITAIIASSYHREVAAFPGHVGSKYSSGCNELIRINKAGLITCVEDLNYLMGWDQEPQQKQLQMTMFNDLSEDETMLLNILRKGPPAQFDDLKIQSGLSQTQLASLLLSLEFKGAVKVLPGKIYASG